MSLVKKVRPAQIQSFPIMDSENNDYAHSNAWPPLHLSQGPISAPAVPSGGDDYFTFVSSTKGEAEDYASTSQHEHSASGLPHADHHQHTRFSQWNPSQGNPYAKSRGQASTRQRIISEKKARHKSRLSNSITHEVETPHSIGSSSPSLGNHSFEHPEGGDQGNLSNHQMSYKRKNPGFHIALDNLQGAGLAKPKDRQPTLVSVGSESRLDLTYQNMKISEPDLFFHQHGGEWDSGQENVTPLMNPPNTTDQGYFGSLNVHSVDNSGLSLDGGMPAGYLSFPKDLEGSSAPRSEENSTDFDEFANIPLDGFSPVPESFEEFNPDFGQTGFESSYVQSISQNSHSHAFHLPPQQFDYLPNQAEPVPHTHVHPPAQHIPQSHQNNANHSIVPPENFNHALPNNNSVLPSQYRQAPFEYQKQVQQPGQSNVPVHQTLFSNRPILERSQSAQSAMQPVVKVDAKKKKKSSRVVVCPICDKHISRDFTRHSRIHNEIGRFQCVFPRSTCSHRSGKFNRPYDYKKHLLNVHFSFDDPKARLAANLKDKLLVRGHCNSCGKQFIGNDWLEEHVLNADKNKRCPELQHGVEVDDAVLKSAEIEEEDELKEYLKQDLSD